MNIREEEKILIKKFIEKSEGLEIDEAIKTQVQNVLRELAKLLGLIDGELELFNIETNEIKQLRESGSIFFKNVVKIARKMDIQMQ